MDRRVRWVVWRGLAIGAMLWAADVARSQVAITEIMVSPGGSDALWEWVEVRNTSAAEVDLNGWIFQDDDGAHLIAPNTSNIQSTNGNTIVPAGGVAVLYPGDALEFTPQRFLDAWGSGITLVGVNSFGNGLANDGDAIGLWQNHDDYMLDMLPGTMSPRRTFAHAKSSINYDVDNGFPPVASGRSIAWNGVGSVTDAVNWVQSEEGDLGAFASVETTIASAEINSTDDLGNPGVLPAGPATPGLRITEIMFAPKSPQVTVGYSEADFEWIEVLNNTAAAIDFSATRYVIDDIAGSQISPANIASGALGAGGTGVLFNSAKITAADMEAMWGGGNYIPVSNWPSLNNSGGDTIAIWDSLADYNSEPVKGTGRTHENAVAAVTYNTVAGQGWPTINNQSSIYLKDLTADPNAGASWARSAEADVVSSRRAVAIFQTAIDHPGDDVGSPGFVPGAVIMPVAGDYNQNGVVDAADYVVWRNALDTPTTLPNDTTPGTVTPADYEVWRANFGRTSAGGSGLGSASVPEPASVAVGVIGAALLSVGNRARRRRRRIV